MKTKKCLLVLCLFLGLTPLLWFRPGCIIDGGDINFPLDPVRRLQERVFAWNDLYNGGIDISNDLASIPPVALTAFFYKLTGSIIWTQKLYFVFWFLLQALAIYYLAAAIFSRRWFIARLTAILFYLYNFYQVTVWSSINIALIIALIAVPLLLGLVIRRLRGRISARGFILRLALVSIIWGCIGINPPVVLLTFFILGLYLAFYALSGRRYRNWGQVKRILAVACLLVLIFVLVNCYYILPFINNHLLSYAGKVEMFERYNIEQYLHHQVKQSSLLNVIRLMGFSEFYFDWFGEPHFPFFEKYIIKRKYILFSFLLPFLAFGALVVYRRQKELVYFALLAVFGILLGMGSHPPLGETYGWLIRNIPLFWLFRSPALKFSLFTALAYPVLAGAFCQAVYNFSAKRKWRPLLRQGLALGLLAPIVGAHLCFMNAFIKGEIFPEAKQRKILKPLQIKVPSYIFSAARWVNKQKGNFNILLLPDQRMNVYTWGFQGLTDVSEMLWRQGIIKREYEERGVVSDLHTIYRQIAFVLYRQVNDQLVNLLRRVRVQFICQRNDYDYQFYKAKDSPRFIKERLQVQRDIRLQESIGQWDFYSVPPPLPLFQVVYDFGVAIMDPEAWRFLPNTVFADARLGQLPLAAYAKEAVRNIHKYPDIAAAIKMFGRLYRRPGYIFLYNPEGDILKRLKRLLNVCSWPVAYLYFPDWSRSNSLFGCQNLFYQIKAKLSLKIQEGFTLRKAVAVPARLTEWEIGTCNADYELVEDAAGGYVKVMFDGDSREDEYIALTKGNLDIDLAQYPWLEMFYRVANPHVQTIELLFGLDLDGDGRIDEYLRGLRTAALTKQLTVFRKNILQFARNRFPGRQVYRLVSVELFPHKLWKVDCRRQPAWFDFGIKKIRFAQGVVDRYVEKRDYLIRLSRGDIVTAVSSVPDNILTVEIPFSPQADLKGSRLQLEYRFLWSVNGLKLSALFADGRCIDLDWLKAHRGLRKSEIKLGEVCRQAEGAPLAGLRLTFQVPEWPPAKPYQLKKILALNSIKIYRPQKLNIQGLKRMAFNVYRVGREEFSVPLAELLAHSEGYYDERVIHIDSPKAKLTLLMDDDEFIEFHWLALIPQLLQPAGATREVTYQKVNPTAYRLRFKPHSLEEAPPMLIMRQNYSHNWQAKMRQPGGCWQRLNNRQRIDGYANAWLLENIDPEKEVEVILSYRPQQFFYLGLGISVVSLLIFIGSTITHKK